MLEAAKDAVGQVAAVAFWTSATTGALALLALEALLIGGWAGAALAASIPFTAWGGGAARRRVLATPIRIAVRVRQPVVHVEPRPAIGRQVAFPG